MLCLTSHQQLRSYGDGATALSFIQQTGEAVFLLDLIVYVPSTIFQLNRDGSSWVESVQARINVSCSRTTTQ